MNLRLHVSDQAASDTLTMQTTVGVDLQSFMDPLIVQRIVAGDPDTSGLLGRMLERGTDTAMPPLATERVDPAGIDAVRSWIASLR